MDISNEYSRDELELGSQTYPGKATMDHLENSNLLLCDLNLPSKLIKEVCQGMPQSAVKIADPTSVYKVDKLFEIGLENFDVLTPNMDEYLALCRQCAVKEYGSDSADDYKIEDFIDPDGYWLLGLGKGYQKERSLRGADSPETRPSNTSCIGVTT